MPAKKKPKPPAPSAPSGRDRLRQRLQGEADALALAAVRALLSQPAAELVDAAAVAALCAAILDSDELLPAIRRQTRATLERELATRSEKTPAELLPPRSAERLRQVLGDPTWGSGPGIRKLAENEVLEQVMGATLYEVLREFALTVNPFFSSWGLPALLKKAGIFGKLGFFGVNLESGGRFLEGLREEFERQLEPHLKTFLQKSAKAALVRAVDLAQSEERLAAFAALRVRLFDQALQTPVSRVSVDRARLDALEDLVYGLFQDARQALRRSDLKARIARDLKRVGRRDGAALLKELGLDSDGAARAAGSSAVAGRARRAGVRGGAGQPGACAEGGLRAQPERAPAYSAAASISASCMRRFLDISSSISDFVSRTRSSPTASCASVGPADSRRGCRSCVRGRS